MNADKIVTDNTQQDTPFSDIKKLTKGAGITLGGNMAGKGLLFVYTIFLAKVLGPEDLGVYFLGLTIVKTLTILSILGLDTGVVRYVSIYHGRNDLGRMKGAVVFSTIISMVPSILFICASYLGGDFVASSVFHKPELGPIIKLLSLAIPLDALLRIFLCSANGLKFMQYSAVIENVVWISLRFFFALVFLYGLGLNHLEGIVLAYIFSSLISAGLAFFYSNRLFNLLGKKTEAIFENRQLLRFSIPMVFTHLVYEWLSHLDILMLGMFVSASDIGIYGVAVRLIMLAQVVFMAFQPIFQPLVAELHDNKQIDRLTNLLKVTTHWSLTISFPVFLALLAFPKFFLHFFGEQYTSGANCLSVLVIAFAISALSNLPSSVIVMIGKSKLSLKINIYTLIINAVLNLALIPLFGIIGAAFATGIAFICLCILRLMQVYSLLKIYPLKRSMWKPVTAGFFSLIVVLLLKNMAAFQGNVAMFFFLLLFFVLYFILIFLLKFDKDQIQMGNLLKNKLLSLIR